MGRPIDQGNRVREDITFDLVNVYNSAVSIVGTRTGVSDWTFTSPVRWSSGSTEVPSDRVLPQLGTIVRTRRAPAALLAAVRARVPLARPTIGCDATAVGGRVGGPVSW